MLDVKIVLLLVENLLDGLTHALHQGAPAHRGGGRLYPEALAGVWLSAFCTARTSECPAAGPATSLSQEQVQA